MPPERRAIFLIDLLQDVNIVRPLILLAGLRLRVPVEILTSTKFAERDIQGIWRDEVNEIAARVGAPVHVFAGEYDAFRILQGKSGILVAGSESDLSGHTPNHNVFRSAPAGFLRVALQHGYECIGFLQNREHNRAHGRDIGFAADVLCGWSEIPALASTPLAHRSKLLVTGPTAVLPLPDGAGSPADAEAPAGGLVCENLHSVRLNASGDFKAPFMDTFFRFCAALAERGEEVTLRPHPGGQYVLKNKVPLPDNVRLENRPIYKVPLARFAYGISAPSSVLVDMILAGIPAAVWQDGDAVMDARNYDGLTVISGMEDWLAFHRDVAIRPEMILDRQRDLLARARLVTDPQEVERRFLGLLSGSLGIRAAAETEARPPKRILFVANGNIPTLQLSFLVPLAPLREAGRLDWEVWTEEGFKEEYGQASRSAATAEALRARFDALDPDVVVFCRYSGPHAPALVAQARSRGRPVVYHVDDDLLNIPIEIGERKWRSHNHPNRLEAVRHLLGHADLVYCSTPALMARFRGLGFDTPMVAGQVYCTGRVIAPATIRPVRRVGYMGFDHSHDFQLAVPALVRYLRAHPEVEFQLFGSIPKPEALDEFGEQVTLIEPVRDYDAFLQRLASLEWDIGICPLADLPFNAVKADTKWVEYTSAGAAVIATGGTIYDRCCADGCGRLANGEDAWLAALEDLTAHPETRRRMVERAQRRLATEYSRERLREQILGVLSRAEQDAHRDLPAARALQPAS
ncbi:glycosyltransferase [Muricoccus radiodurans]|uniref:glycosyltransferase n=1 Tax=Muricoccus radiodurans TaxID=2231721 RepID=UPI003CF324AE